MAEQFQYQWCAESLLHTNISPTSLHTYAHIHNHICPFSSILIHTLVSALSQAVLAGRRSRHSRGRGR